MNSSSSTAAVDAEAAALDHRVDALCAIVAKYLPPDQVQAIREACYFAADAHAGVFRKSGDPYIYHPIAVATILTEVQFDCETLLAAILHDVIEDTSVNKEQLSERFGSEVAQLVDGVSKLTHIAFQSKREAQAENFRKMFLAMAKDIRVIMVKLADRLHNMRTLQYMSPGSRVRIARETLELYAPIALRLGMNHLRLELENLGFKHLYPLRYRVLENALKKRIGHRKELVQQLEKRICDRLAEDEIQVRRVSGREKHLWGIYLKMRHKHLSFNDVHDIYGFRILTDSVDTCYRVLGCMHGLYKPVMGRFKDYIAIPKENGYQSLHTVLFGPNRLLIEVQIRTYDMHVMAEAGIAAHWLYKSPEGQVNTAHQKAREWLRNLLDIQRRAGNSVEFLENVKVDLFPNDIYVFTPAGEIVELPRGATVVDFAYAIHSDIGNTCVGAKVDRRFVPLRTQLGTGQTVEVILSPTARPDPAWLSFVVTAKARASIRHFLNHLQRSEAIILGKRLLEKVLPSSNRVADLPPKACAALATDLKVNSFDDLLADIGFGKRLAPIIAKLLVPEQEHHEALTAASVSDGQPLLIKGTEGAVVSFGRCCRPIPGDPVIAHLSAGRGVVIHRDSCKNIAEYDKEPDKWLEVEWEDTIEGLEFQAELRLNLDNKRGVLAKIASVIADAQANIENINTSEKDGTTTIVDLILNVHGRMHLAQIMRRLRRLPSVRRMSRRH